MSNRLEYVAVSLLLYKENTIPLSMIVKKCRKQRPCRVGAHTWTQLDFFVLKQLNFCVRLFSVGSVSVLISAKSLSFYYH